MESRTLCSTHWTGIRNLAAPKVRGIDQHSCLPESLSTIKSLFHKVNFISFGAVLWTVAAFFRICSLEHLTDSQIYLMQFSPIWLQSVAYMALSPAIFYDTTFRLELSRISGTCAKLPSLNVEEWPSGHTPALTRL